jgi:ribonuclease G
MADKNILVINAAGAETRVALVEAGTIHEYYLERKREKGIVGNIYKGRVVRVLPGMQAAFVDIGLEKAAFLYVGDVYGDPDFSEEFELTEGEHAGVIAEVPSEEEAVEQEARAQAGEALPPAEAPAPGEPPPPEGAAPASLEAQPPEPVAATEAPPSAEASSAPPSATPTSTATATPTPTSTPTPTPTSTSTPTSTPTTTPTSTSTAT